MNEFKTLFALAVLAGACTGEVSTPVNDSPEEEGSTVGGEDSTYDHDNSGADVFDLLERIAEEGPPKYSSRMHGCTKVRYETLGNVLASFGVNMADGNGTSAAGLYNGGYTALGGPNYTARVRENIDVTTSAASRLFDIFASAAPEIIASMPTLEKCQRGGVAAQMFNESNQCTEQGVTCLLGTPATAAHIELCNETITRASNPDLGKELAVATVLAAAHTCE